VASTRRVPAAESLPSGRAPNLSSAAAAVPVQLDRPFRPACVSRLSLAFFLLAAPVRAAGHPRPGMRTGRPSHQPALKPRNFGPGPVRSAPDHKAWMPVPCRWNCVDVASTLYESGLPGASVTAAPRASASTGDAAHALTINSSSTANALQRRSNDTNTASTSQERPVNSGNAATRPGSSRRNWIRNSNPSLRAQYG
jgi:hypothetical protein